MTWSAPIDRAVSTFLVLHTAVTSAAEALWQSAPQMCPRHQTRLQSEPCGLAGSVPCHEDPAAPCLPRWVPLPRPQTTGWLASAPISLQEHIHTRQTRSLRNLLPRTPRRRAETALRFCQPLPLVPAISQPRILCFGVRSPGITRFHGAPFIKNKSRGFTDAAQSLIKTSLSAGRRCCYLCELQHVG